MYNDKYLIDTIVLNAKYYLYKCFLQKTCPTVKQFKTIVLDVEDTEHFIATQKGRLYVHEQKWGRIRIVR